MQKFSTVSYRIPLQSVPYRTVTAASSRYTVSQNTVPSKSFFFLLSYFGELYFTNKLFFSKHLEENEDNYAFERSTATMNIWIGIEQLFLEIKTSLFSRNATQTECGLKTEQALSFDGCSSCTVIWTWKSRSWTVTIGNVKKVLASVFDGKIFEIISMSLSVFIDMWLKKLSSSLNRLSISTCISRVIYQVLCCFKRLNILSMYLRFDHFSYRKINHK